MGRFVNSKTGVVVSVDDSKDDRFAAPGWRVYDGSGSASTGGYSSMKVADLRAEIERRNEGREEADLLSVEGKKADLVSVLEADDAARAEQ